MKIGEEHLALTHQGIFRCNWLFDLQDHLGTSPYFLRGIEYLCSCYSIGIVRDGRTEPCTLLDDDFMPVVDEFLHTGGSDRNAILMVLDLFWNTNEHFATPSIKSWPSSLLLTLQHRSKSSVLRNLTTRGWAGLDCFSLPVTPQRSRR